MKIFFSIVITLSFLGCGGTSPTPEIESNPSWYMEQTLKTDTKYEIIGYGEGSNLDEAKANAKEDIAQKLSSNVQSSMSIISNDEGSKSNANLNITTNINLVNLKTLKMQEVNSSYFVALKYENLDLAYRMKKSFGDTKCENGDVNSYIKNTTIFQNITSAVGCELSIKLQRENSAWYLTYKEQMFLLNNSEFEQFYESINNQKYTFMANQKVLKDGDSFYFNLSSDEMVYVTLLDVYENGIVTLLQDSILIDKKLQIPSKDSQSYFEAGLVKENQDTHDLYVAIFTKEPLDMSRFEYANEELASSELAYKFDQLINFIDKYEYATILLRTKVK